MGCARFILIQSSPPWERAGRRGDIVKLNDTAGNQIFFLSVLMQQSLLELIRLGLLFRWEVHLEHTIIRR
jgi:hypothetical protein